jgi:hypothetical protein
LEDADQVEVAGAGVNSGSDGGGERKKRRVLIPYLTEEEKGAHTLLEKSTKLRLGAVKFNSFCQK